MLIQIITDTRTHISTVFMIISIIMSVIASAVAIWNWATVGYAELQNKVLEDKRKQEAEEEATERFLGFSNAVKQMNNSIVNAVKEMEDREKESFTILKNLEAAAAEKQQEGDEMFATIIQALKEAMKEVKKE
ncbi:hypothetical protein TWF225_003763 [Orbilia oligospora]|nr:hypothetical protein TWF225_003763 [Orbilia oligospora]KAF3254231.1 hypothetical protein TWF217_007195 [Orbilia oligospora]KAF3267692.1 hypothetical protein TWF128_009197 [Orbilia oligospora]